MAVPIQPSNLTTGNFAEGDAQTAVLRRELDRLNDESERLSKFRDYADGEHPLAYTTDRFTEVFGSVFSGFKDNWMEVIVDAVETKLDFDGLKAAGGLSTDPTSDIANRVWTALLENDIYDESSELHEALLVQERSYAIVWPERSGTTRTARIDWQPANLVSVRYHPDRRREAMWAIKRWEDDEGRILVNVYTREAVYKYIDREASVANMRRSSTSAYSEVPPNSPGGTFEPRRVAGEPWPLPHPFGRVPVVEFNNRKYRSEIRDAIPLQDGLNRTLVDMMVNNMFQAFNQRYVESAGEAPVGGWVAGPGETWHFKPAVDHEGKFVRGQYGTFPAGNPEGFLQTTETFLEHMALITATPPRLFRTPDQGGRGDAPSGQALQITDQAYNEKIRKLQTRLSSRWGELNTLVAKAIGINQPIKRTDLLPNWRDPRFDFRLSVLEEAKMMMDLGIPFKWVVRQLGLRPSEVDEIVKLKDEEEDERQKQFEAQQAAETRASTNVSAERGLSNRPTPDDPRRVRSE